MLFAYRAKPGGLERLAVDADPAGAIWIDLYRPMPAQIAAVEALGVSLPSREDMEEIELSARLSREPGREVMTVTLPGQTPEKTDVAGPVTMILTPERLVTLRYHMPRPFETYPLTAARGTIGPKSVDRVFLGLTGEIVARLADLLEGAGRVLDDLSGSVFGAAGSGPEKLRAVLREVGRQGELLGRVRGALLTMGRALTFFGQVIRKHDEGERLALALGAQQRDIEALGVQIDFLSARISLIADATLGMINLDQNANIRLFSVVAVFFLPPTLVASVYGMNFRLMPELDASWGYPAALGLMVASALATWAFFKWRNWL